MSKLEQVVFLEDWLQIHRANLIQGLAKYNVKLTVDKDYPELGGLSYRINASQDSEVVAASRGTVVNLESLKVVSYSFTRFFNVTQQTNYTTFDWLDYRIEEKLDGSLLTLYNHNNTWHVATSGTPRASGSVSKNSTKTFSELFFELYKQKQLPKPVKGYIYVFELCSLENKVLVKYPEPELYLLTVRSAESFKEVKDYRSDPRFAAFTKPKLYNPSFKLGYVRSILDKMNLSTEITQEGLILVDRFNRRLKAKNLKHVQISNHLNNGYVDICELYKGGHLDEFVSYIPKYKKEADDLKNQLRLCKDIVEYAVECYRETALTKHERFSSLEHLGSLRYVVLEILNNPTTYCSFEDFVSQITINAFKKLLVQVKEHPPRPQR